MKRSSCLSGLALAAVAFMGAEPAFAQSIAAPPGYTPRPGDRVFRWTMWNQQQAQRYEAAAQTALPLHAPIPVVRERPSTDVEVAISRPVQNNPIMVDIRQPDGTTRTFRLAGGQEIIQVRRVILHPGESLVLRVNPAPPARP